MDLLESVRQTVIPLLRTNAQARTQRHRDTKTHAATNLYWAITVLFVCVVVFKTIENVKILLAHLHINFKWIGQLALSHTRTHKHKKAFIFSPHFITEYVPGPLLWPLSNKGHPSLCEQEINLQNENKHWLLMWLFYSPFQVHLISPNFINDSEMLPNVTLWRTV